VYSGKEMSTPSYDLIVIGAGPAGLTAATEAARAGLKTLCLDKLAPGGVLINLGDLQDFDEIWNGPDMASRLTDDATVAGVEIGFGEVTGLSGDGPWTIETADGESHTAPTIVIATGLDKGRLGLPDEEEYARVMDEVAKEKHVGLFHRFEIMRAWYNDGMPYSQFVINDGLHLNDFGQKCIGRLLSVSLLDAIKPQPAASTPGASARATA